MSAQKRTIRNSIPTPLHETVQKERGRLLKADAILGCLAIAMDCEADIDAVDFPCFSDVVQIARELVSQAVDSLDVSALQHQSAGNRVKEDFCLLVGHASGRELAALPGPVQGGAPRGPRWHVPQLHRRNYRSSGAMVGT